MTSSGFSTFNLFAKTGPVLRSHECMEHAVTGATNSRQAAPLAKKSRLAECATVPVSVIHATEFDDSVDLHAGHESDDAGHS